MWFKPRCPVTDDQREWLEDSLLWLNRKFRTDTFCASPTVLPTDKFFPTKYNGTEDCAAAVLDTVAMLMEVPKSSVTLQTYSERDDDFLDALPYISRHSQGSAGHFQLKKKHGRYVIGIEREQLGNPFSLVATLAHELGHVLLLGGGLLKPTDSDQELMTDLLTVYFGLGVFTANCAFEFAQWQSGGRAGWSASRTGYLSESMFGYALALYARMRGESKPPWLSFLDGNIRSAFEASERYMRRGGPCVVKAVC